MRARRGSEDWPVHVLVRYRFAFQAAVDMLLWGPALFLATWARYDFQLDSVNLAGIGLLACVAGAAQVVVGARWGLYIHRWRYGTIDEVAALGRTIVVVTTLVALLNRFAFGHAIPISASVAGGFVALVLMAMVRYTWRIFLDRALRPDDESAERVVVLGAGDGGHQTVTAMLTNPDSPYLPVAVLEDHPDRQKMRLRGVPVLGTRDDFERVVDQTGATVLVIAIPSAGGELIREMAGRADEIGIRTRVLPPVNELFGAVIGVADIRPVTEVDLLGRHEIDTDLHAVADYVAGKRVLITGAGGSIGSELCRQVNLFAPAELIMLDRDESALHSVQLSLEGRAMLDDPNLVVADLRDAERMDEVFALHRPDVVFHAAALKHLPLLEMHPAEGYKTNVWGTQNVLEAAAHNGVERFVNVSTDKAADPTSVLGRTKRLAEQLTALADKQHEGTYLSVRFGNVLGSRGSVLPAFRAQIEAGGPVTVTHPDVTRFFMTVEEAVQLVIQAGAIGGDGEVLVLDMGEPVKIVDVARRLVAEADRSIEIVFTGLRHGEKMHEVLFSDGEADRRPHHPLISHCAVPAMSVADVALVAETELAEADRPVCASVDPRWSSKESQREARPPCHPGSRDRLLEPRLRGHRVRRHRRRAVRSVPGASPAPAESGLGRAADHAGGPVRAGRVGLARAGGADPVVRPGFHAAAGPGGHRRGRLGGDGDGAVRRGDHPALGAAARRPGGGSGVRPGRPPDRRRDGLDPPGGERRRAVGRCTRHRGDGRGGRGRGAVRRRTRSGAAPASFPASWWPLVAVVLWASAWGSIGRPSAMAGCLACFGVLLAEPIRSWIAEAVLSDGDDDAGPARFEIDPATRSDPAGLSPGRPSETEPDDGSWEATVRGAAADPRAVGPVGVPGRCRERPPGVAVGDRAGRDRDRRDRARSRPPPVGIAAHSSGT